MAPITRHGEPLASPFGIDRRERSAATWGHGGQGGDRVARGRGARHAKTPSGARPARGRGEGAARHGGAGHAGGGGAKA